MEAQTKGGKKQERILWIMDGMGKGSGGQRTVFQNIMFLIEKGYKCDLYFMGTKISSEKMRKQMVEWYGISFPGEIICDDVLRHRYAAVFATYYTTVKEAVNLKAKHKIYFVQDYEPWFFPMSEERLEAKTSYALGLKPITIGNWLAKEMYDKFDTDAKNISFCADLNVYHMEDDIDKENAICFVYQPDKPWRCVDMGLRALQIVQAIKPEVKIYLYGSEKKVPFNIRAEHLGILSVEECNKLYNRCKVGLCMSASNPSRIPFEMMATGLPVVDLYLENNLYDLSDRGCLLAEPSAEAIAAAILKILNNQKTRLRLSNGGREYMKNFPLERGFEEFGRAVDDIINDRKIKRTRIMRRCYEQKAIMPIKIDISLPKRVYFKTKDELEAEAEIKRQEEERRKREIEEYERKKAEEEWRRNLTVPQKVYLKLRYILLGR